MSSRVTRWCLSTCAAVLCGLALAASAGALTLEEYSANVSEAHDLAANAPTAMTQRQGTDLAIAINTLVPGTVEVETPEGALDVDNSVTRALVASLDAADAPTDRAEIAAEIEAHLASMVRVLGEPGVSVEQDPEALSRLLSERVPQTRSPLSEFIGRLVERLGILLEKWWSTIGASPGASATLTTITIAVVVVLILILMWLLVRVILRARAGSQRRPAPLEAISSADAVIEAARDLPPDALAYADECAGRGEMREAVRALFGGAARELQEAGFIVEVHMRTNRELLLEVRPRSQATYEPLEALSRTFERAWYGHHAVAPEEYAVARTWFLGVRDALAAREGDGA